MTGDWVDESQVELDGRVWAVRQAGDPAGRPLVYLHGTPSCRLEPAFADQAAAELGVRIVSFDRPGYAQTPPAPFGLASVAVAAGGIAERLGLGRFATLGQSGGGPFSLACAAVLGDQITRTGVAAGAVPYQLMPGLLDLLDEVDSAALALLPDRDAAAAVFASGFEPLRQSLLGPEELVVAGMRARWSARDGQVLEDTAAATVLVTALRESMVRGPSGGG